MAVSQKKVWSLINHFRVMCRFKCPEKIELAIANNLPTKKTEGINAKNSYWPDVSNPGRVFLEGKMTTQVL